MSKKQELIIKEKDRQIAELRSKVEDYETAVKDLSKSVDAVLYEVVKKYGDEEMQITISVPDIENAKLVTAKKEDDAYVIRVSS